MPPHQVEVVLSGCNNNNNNNHRSNNDNNNNENNNHTKENIMTTPYSSEEDHQHQHNHHQHNQHNHQHNQHGEEAECKHDEEDECHQHMSSSTTTTTTSSSTSTSGGGGNVIRRDYDPTQRIYSQEQLSVLNLVVHPIWIFDYLERRMRWANHAGLNMWNASTLEELQARSFQEISEASAKRMEDYLLQFERGMNVTDQWTNYPNGKATTCHMNVSGIQFQEDEDIHNRHFCVMCEGVPLVKEELLQDNLRGVEMIRHLPMAVCQFDMEGTLMFQNPEASMSSTSTSTSTSASTTSATATATTTAAAAPSSSSSVNRNNNHNHNHSRSHDTEEEECKEGELMDTSNHHQSRSHHTEEEESKEGQLLDESNHHIHNHNHHCQDDFDQSCRSNFTQDSSCSTSMRGGGGGGGGGNGNSHHNTKNTSGSLLQRFADPAVGRQVLQEIQSSSLDKMDLEAMIQTRKGCKWSAIQLRKGKDPVTGEPIILYSARDKSDAIQAQKERKAREQKSEFLAIMAHEIRTPLHQVTGFIDLLDQTILDVEQKSFVRLLKSSAKGLMTVISDVLDYSKLEAGKMKLESIPYEPLSVVEGSLAAVRGSCEEKKLYLHLEWNKGIPYKVKGDPNRLRQILLNLLSNAVKFTKDGGITVRAMPVLADDDKKIKNHHHHQQQQQQHKPMVRFEVADTGMGISAQHKTVIFRKYQQANAAVARNFGGTGLGLSICQLLVQNMGGTIGVDSERGQGAVFWVTLPAEVPAEGDDDLAERMDEDPAEHADSLHVLVAEDNKVNQKLLANMLKRMGHTSDMAWNGKQAIEMLEQQNSCQHYDVVLMDIQMPVMDGLEATRRIRSMGYAHLPIFGLTASVARSDFGELGFDDWLPKPMTMKELRSKLNRVHSNHS